MVSIDSGFLLFVAFTTSVSLLIKCLTKAENILILLETQLMQTGTDYRKNKNLQATTETICFLALCLFYRLA